MNKDVGMRRVAGSRPVIRRRSPGVHTIRRADANAGRYAPDRVIMDEGDPDREAKVAAVRAKYLGKIVIIREIIDSRVRRVEVPEVAEGSGTSLPAARP